MPKRKKPAKLPQLTMRPVPEKRIELKGHISRYFESPKPPYFKTKPFGVQTSNQTKSTRHAGTRDLEAEKREHYQREMAKRDARKRLKG